MTQFSGKDIIRNQAIRKAARLVAMCAADLEDAKARLDRAGLIVSHLRTGKRAAECLVPLHNVTAEPVARAASQVEILLQLLADEFES